MELENMLRICALIGVLTVTSILGQSSNTSISNGCVHLQSCGKCIQAQPNCAWCKDEDYKIDPLAPRCDFYSNLQRRCSEKDIVNPQYDVKYPQNKQLSKPGAEVDQVIQIKPQKVDLKLRPGIPFELDMAYREAPDYPVDLYYLMDLSQSMKDDKDNLEKLGGEIATEMQRITKNFTLGFGSFVDKIVMPYVSTVPEKLKNPCPGCAKPYGFKNHMSLSQETKKFTTEVRKAEVSGNLDAPEGGFDAIMQSVMCDRIIGWREFSRKLIVFSTDSGFHYAGDGKLGGIVKPNDGQCHLNSKGEYTESTNMDYPSLSQLNQKIKEKKMTVIFAVTSGQISVYNQLSENLESATAGELANDSSNIVTLIRKQYEKITSAVELKDDADDRYVKVSYFSKCLGSKSENKNKCDGLKVGTTVHFTIMFEVVGCPNETNSADLNQIITIAPVGLTEKLIVNLTMICECDCERRGFGERRSPKCNGTGTYQCGTCDCPSDRTGRFCECDSSESGIGSEDACKQPNTTMVCSNRGICNCGQCHCFTNKKGWEHIYGPYCECSDYSCDRHDKKMCNGPDKGQCRCNKCVCKPGWSGSACQCSERINTCIAPTGNQDVLCSGRGACVCGKCECYKEKNGTNYIGLYCDECPTCEGKCSHYRPCVQCKVFKSGELNEEQCANDCLVEIEEVDKAEVENRGEQGCVFKDDDDCRFTFVYGFNTTTNYPYIRVQRTKDCPTPVNILMIVLGVIGGIVAIGLCLLLIWKLLTTIHDRREFAEFEKQRQMAKWDTGENPIFKQATSTFNNPTYGRK